MCPPRLSELPALRQTDGSHLSDVLPPARDAETGRWTRHLLALRDLDRSLKVGDKNRCCDEAAEEISPSPAIGVIAQT